MAVFVVNANGSDVHDALARAIGVVRLDWHDGRTSEVTPSTWRLTSQPGLCERFNLVDSCQQFRMLLRALRKRNY